MLSSSISHKTLVQKFKYMQRECEEGESHQEIKGRVSKHSDRDKNKDK